MNKAVDAPAILFDDLIARGLDFTAKEFHYLRRRIKRLDEDDVIVFRNTRRVRRLLKAAQIAPPEPETFGLCICDSGYPDAICGVCK